MYFSDQASYEANYSPQQREKRHRAAVEQGERAISEALRLFNTGDEESARQRLCDAGFQDEGIAYYLAVWRN